MRKLFVPVPILFLLIFFSCKNNEEGDNGQAATSGQDIYLDYVIAGEEDEDEVACVFRFHKGGKNGDAIRLKEPARVELDGQPVQPDSAGLTGVVYEVRKSLGEFAGVHRISFIDAAKRQFTEEFTFSPFTLKTEIPEQVSRSRFRIDLNGVERGTRIRYVMMDTSVDSKGLNEVVTLRNSTLEFDARQLQKIKNGPVILLLIQEEDRSLRNATKRGGKLSITYSLRRDFELVN